MVFEVKDESGADEAVVDAAVVVEGFVASWMLEEESKPELSLTE